MRADPIRIPMATFTLPASKGFSDLINHLLKIAKIPFGEIVICRASPLFRCCTALACLCRCFVLVPFLFDTLVFAIEAVPFVLILQGFPCLLYLENSS